MKVLAQRVVKLSPQIQCSYDAGLSSSSVPATVLSIA
jgi:hypothetical protein